MSTKTQARDAVAAAIRTAWLANGTSAPVALQWDDVAADPIGHDANGRPLPWARVTIRTFVSPVDAFGGTELKYMTEGAVVVQIFTPAGTGNVLGDQLAQVLVDALRGERVGDLYFYAVRAPEIGRDGPWFRTDVVAGFRHEERKAIA